ncbi:MAG: flagellar protein FlgN [Syntrophomonadaceae bacterium]|nr:flagellar protein FlgN [Syntrophomonadaceae bacterium]
MQAVIQRFHKCIQAENELIGELIVSALNKKSAIIVGDLNGLNEIMRQESGMVQTLGQLEEERLAEQTALVESLGIQQDVTANILIEAMRAAGVGSWFESKSLIEGLAWNLQRLKEHNAINSGLLEQSLVFIENMENLITRESDTTYSGEGEGNAARARSLVDKTI